jgi:hypothetical protein
MITIAIQDGKEGYEEEKTDHWINIQLVLCSPLQRIHQAHFF